MLVVPQAGDQLFIARQVEKLGAGLLVDPRRFTPASLREQAERVLGEVAFRQRSRVLGDSLREAGGYRRAADEVLVFTRR
jgi:UDP:flavonoid glycosyltransferase YjiC (YdhE family)